MLALFRILSSMRKEGSTTMWSTRGRVETHRTWQRSSYCGNNGCIEIAVEHDQIIVRDSKKPRKALAFDRSDWLPFTTGVKAGEFDLP
jgi:hypothetical protein